MRKIALLVSFLLAITVGWPMPGSAQDARKQSKVDSQAVPKSVAGAPAARPSMVRKIEESEREEKTGNLLLVPRKMTEKIELGLVRLKKGEKNRLASHPDEEEGYLLLKGSGVLLLGETKHPVAAGMVAYVPANTTHQIECTSDEPLEYVYFASWR